MEILLHRLIWNPKMHPLLFLFCKLSGYVKTKVKELIKAAVSHVRLWPKLVLQSQSNYCGVWFPSTSPWNRGCQFGCQTEQDHLHLTDFLSQLHFILPKWRCTCWNLVPCISGKNVLLHVSNENLLLIFSKESITNQLDDPSTYMLAYYEEHACF